MLRCLCLLMSVCAVLVFVLLLYQTLTPHIGNNQTTKPPPDINPIPPDMILEQMSHKDLEDFYHSYVDSPQVLCNRVIRMGKVKDGGWELCDDPVYRPTRNNCLVYSFGINFDFSYDDAMASYGCHVHAFDPSMQTNEHVRGQRVFFHPTGIGPLNQTFLGGPKDDQVWQLYTLANHRQVLGHIPLQKRVDIVKMDVDSHEVKALTVALDEGSLDDVRQLNFESHLNLLTTNPTKSQYIEFLQLFRKLWDSGFRIYLTHRNHMWSAFVSTIDPGREFVKCHEVHTVNIHHKNSLHKHNL